MMCLTDKRCKNRLSRSILISDLCFPATVAFVQSPRMLESLELRFSTRGLGAWTRSLNQEPEGPVLDLSWSSCSSGLRIQVLFLGFVGAIFPKWGFQLPSPLVPLVSPHIFSRSSFSLGISKLLRTCFTLWKYLAAADINKSTTDEWINSPAGGLRWFLNNLLLGQQQNRSDCHQLMDHFCFLERPLNV